MATISLFLTRVLLMFSPESTVLVYTQIIVAEFLFTFAFLNIGLAVFNLIPLPPLDGSKVLFVSDIDLCGINSPEKAAKLFIRLQ
mgnify:CR=1 FL=1